MKVGRGREGRGTEQGGTWLEEKGNRSRASLTNRGGGKKDREGASGVFGGVHLPQKGTWERAKPSTGGEGGKEPGGEKNLLIHQEKNNYYVKNPSHL